MNHGGKNYWLNMEVKSWAFIPMIKELPPSTTIDCPIMYDDEFRSAKNVISLAISSGCPTTPPGIHSLREVMKLKNCLNNLIDDI